jgi:DNA-binding FadR family transcriptional regulator
MARRRWRLVAPLDMTRSQLQTGLVVGPEAHGRRTIGRPEIAPVSGVPFFQGAIVRSSVRDAIGQKITSMIASGAIGVGESLPSERDLAAALNVSRESVRGAIQNLAARGIVEVSHGARTRVVKSEASALRIEVGNIKPVDDYDLDTVHSARTFVERRIIADAAKNIADDSLAILSTLIDAQKTAVNDPVRFLISDREFHLVIYRSSTNTLLADFASDLYSFMLNYRRKAIAQPGAIALSIRDHEAILAALKKHDEIAAVAAIGRHTERIYNTTCAVLGLKSAS